MARILIVDDEPLVREVLRQFLAGLGHTVREAVNGQEGLRLFEESPADLVITDNSMPRLTGREMIHTLRREHPDVRIIAMSGGGLGPGTAELVDATLPKPFSRRAFLDLVARLS